VSQATTKQRIRILFHFTHKVFILLITLFQFWTKKPSLLRHCYSYWLGLKLLVHF